MSFYFRHDGSVNLRRLTLSAGFFLTLYTGTFVLGIAKVEDPGIPLLVQGSSLWSDRILYSKLKPLPRQIDELRNKVVAIKNPYKPD